MFRNSPLSMFLLIGGKLCSPEGFGEVSFVGFEFFLDFICLSVGPEFAGGGFALVSNFKVLTKPMPKAVDIVSSVVLVLYIAWYTFGTSTF
jgi:hypothetical protein